ncbi:MAG: MltA domain-containing protein [Pseudomonadota bacterium]
MISFPQTAASEDEQVFPAAMRAVAFSDIDGWATDDHSAAFVAFVQTCKRAVQVRPKSRLNGVDGEDLVRVCQAALDSPETAPRLFFERFFQPMRVLGEGLLTGYFEPEVEASAVQTQRFRYPLYRRPAFLHELPESASALGIDDDVTWGRRTPDGFEAFPERRDIMNGALEGQGLELVWLEDPIDVFFIHIQGSARLAMTDGMVRRLNFAAKSGHPYTPIGRTLVEMGELALADVTMGTIRDWLSAATPAARDAVLASNRSYIFFKVRNEDAPDTGPVAAAGVPLTAGRSLAVDRFLHTFGTPIFVQSDNALPEGGASFQRLMIAQDTGSAIVGPSRGDIFIGSGSEAGDIAGRVNMPVAFTVLVPRLGLLHRSD